MSIGNVTVAGPIVFTFSDKMVSTVGNSFTPLINELNLLTRQGTLPVTLKPRDDGWSMALHTSRFVVWAYPTRGGDAYSLGHAAPRQFRDENRLTRAALLLRCTKGFLVYQDLRTYNLETRNARLPRTTYEDVLWRSWKALETTPAAEVAPKHAHALDLLETVVEASQQIELDRQSAMPAQHYVSRSDVKEQRYSARGVYRFRLAKRGELTTNMMICLGEEPHTRGKVIRVDGNDVTVRFEPGADYDRIRRQGTLRVLPSDRVYRAQKDAISLLRQGESVNQRLLDSLIGAEFQRYQPASQILPQESLDPAGQLEAYQRALAVPDVLCVLGPPGTGKTRTIVEVVRACSRAGQRVLVTSHTHRAVDNVLERLPVDLNMVRIGSEDNMTAKVKAMSSESRAETARAEILADTAVLDRLTQARDRRPLVEKALEQMTHQLALGEPAQHELDRVIPSLAEAVKRASSPIQPGIRAAEQDLARRQAEAAKLENSLESSQGRRAAALAWATRLPILAFLFTWYAQRQQSRYEKLMAFLPAARHARDAATAALATLRDQAERMAAGDPAVVELKALRDNARLTIAGCLRELGRLGDVVRQALLPAGGVAAPAPGDLLQWREFHRSCGESLDRLERRVRLLQEWRGKISDLNAELEREIARYADVVGATCIGTETSALISGIEFDMVIVDEAGQISTPNLLVPLVRSRRAVLVGDHMQLPPFLDEEVRRWAERNPASRQVTDLLARSGFELLFPRAPRTNAVWLTTQRRMPAEIGQFVSSTFYGNRLETVHEGAGPDLIFNSPLAMVDTSDRPARRRAETAMSGLKNSTRHGYRNELEAEIIAGLVVAYRDFYSDWAVIVPFHAQRELIAAKLSTALGASAEVADNIGSVDSFQGGERDLVIFGFTRSNGRGDIGFLRETRRFNVAVTRARRQLVLVGDLESLRLSRDEGFRAVVDSLDAQLAGVGDLRASMSLKDVVSCDE